jgi:hypothetical protein
MATKKKLPPKAVRDDRYLVLTRGLSGLTGYPGPREGYGPITVSIPHDDFERELENVVDDVDNLDNDNIVRAVFAAPMLDTRIPKDEVKACPDIPDYMARGFEGGYADLIALKIAQPAWKGLDFVGVEMFVAYWRANGAKIGRKVDGLRLGDEARREDRRAALALLG